MLIFCLLCVYPAAAVCFPFFFLAFVELMFKMFFLFFFFHLLICSTRLRRCGRQRPGRPTHPRKVHRRTVFFLFFCCCCKQIRAAHYQSNRRTISEQSDFFETLIHRKPDTSVSPSAHRHQSVHVRSLFARFSCQCERGGVEGLKMIDLE